MFNTFELLLAEETRVFLSGNDTDLLAPASKSNRGKEMKEIAVYPSWRKQKKAEYIAANFRRNYCRFQCNPFKVGSWLRECDLRWSTDLRTINRSKAFFCGWSIIISSDSIFHRIVDSRKKGPKYRFCSLRNQDEDEKCWRCTRTLVCCCFCRYLCTTIIPQGRRERKRERASKSAVSYSNML